MKGVEMADVQDLERTENGLDCDCETQAPAYAFAASMPLLVLAGSLWVASYAYANMVAADREDRKQAADVAEIHERHKSENETMVTCSTIFLEEKRSSIGQCVGPPERIAEMVQRWNLRPGSK